MTVREIYKYFKPTKSMFNGRTLLSSDKKWISNSFIAYRRDFFYVPELEKTVSLGKESGIPIESIDKLITGGVRHIAKLNELVQLGSSRPLVALSYEDLDGSHNAMFDARYIGSIRGYLIDESWKKRSDLVKLYVSVEQPEQVSNIVQSYPMLLGVLGEEVIFILMGVRG